MNEKKKYGNNKILLTLFIIGLLLKIFEVEVFFGINLNFSSIAIILIVLLYDIKKSIIIAILINIMDIIFLRNSYFIFIHILEIVSISYLKNKYKKSNLILWDIFFWIIIGMPVLAIGYLITNKGNLNEHFYFEIVFIIVNSILNVYIAETTYTYIIVKKIRKTKLSVDFKNIIIHILTSALLVPFFINVIVDMYESNNYIIDNVHIYSEEIKSFLKGEIKKLGEEQKANLKLASVIEVGLLEERLSEYTKYKKFNIYLLNRREKAIINIINTTYGKVNYDEFNTEEIEVDKMYKLTYKSKGGMLTNEQWLDGYFIHKDKLEELNFDLIVEVPIRIYKERIVGEYVSQFKFLTLFTLFISSIGMILNKVLFNDISKISSISTKFKEYIYSDEEIKWPSSNIVEIRGIINSIKKMFSELRVNLLELKKTENKLYNLAYYDSLTSLPNRLYFKESLQKFSQDNFSSRLGIIFLDLNRFKVINDTLGHNIGDELLVQVSARLKEIDNENITIFRLGGDEFVVVIEISDIEEIYDISNKIAEKFNDKFIINDLVINTSCSLGASIYPDDSKDMDTIIQYADIAMYKAKENESKVVQLFNKELKEIVLQKLIIEKEIYTALNNNEFNLYYQPKYDSLNDEISSLEALIRWSSNELGVVPPDKFISIAEESDLILKIDRWVMIEACRFNKRLQEEGYRKIPISVNISAKHFLNNRIEYLVEEALNISGLESKYLMIEITEGILIKRIEDTQKTIMRLNDLGVSVSIDDFGKGYSSFNQLMNLPIKEVKIDRVFITNIDKDIRKANVVASMMELAHRLELNVVAEGVETEEEKKYVKIMGCNEIQGYVYTKPLPENELKIILKKE